MVQQIYQLVSGYGQTRGGGQLLDGGLEDVNVGDCERERESVME